MKILLILSAGIWLVAQQEKPAQQQKKSNSIHARLLSRGYWLSTTYKLGVDPNKDTSFVPIRYLYSDGKNYTAVTYQDEGHPVVVKSKRGIEELSGILFNKKYVSIDYRDYKFFVRKEGVSYFLFGKSRYSFFKIKLEKVEKLTDY